MTTKKTTKVILTIVIIIFTILLVAGNIWFFYIRSLSKEIVQIKKDIAEEVSINSDFVDLSRQILEIEEKNLQLSNIFVENEGIDFIKKLEDLESQFDVDLLIETAKTERVLGDSKKDDLHGYIKIDFEITGDFESIINYLKTLENMPNHIFISSLDLERIQDQDSDDWNSKISLQVISN